MRKAFTLIELLVVLAIIFILGSILFPVFNHARIRARESYFHQNNIIHRCRLQEIP